MSKRTYFVTGGGTGGHIYPAVAVADELIARGNRVFYVGNKNNLEYSIVKDKGYDFLSVNVHGMPRKFSFELLKWATQLFLAVCKNIFFILKYKPDAVFGTGGYVSAPSLIAAKILRKPYMMHDCDAQPGLVTRKLAPHAKIVSVAFEGAKKFITNKNIMVNGNPIRPAFKNLSKEDARKSLGIADKLTLCVMGGSQGAKTINDATVSILKRLREEFDLQIIFQTGKRNFETVIEHLAQAYPNWEEDKNLLIRPYFDDMTAVLMSSDIAVSRAGSLSLSELEAAGIASILVPYPHAAADHQRKNAKFMVEQGVSLYLEDNETNGETLFDLISELVTNNAKRDEMQKKALVIAKYNGVEKIVEQLTGI